ncbi:MAG TPA: hypothetical protein VMT90_01660 [Dehalococcoidia bacterium]|jgi:hypothetical protein|nr:hypothetical protein [Dehalococcoidia bacterium]
MTGQPLPGLRVVVGWSERRNLCALIGDALEAIAGAGEVRKLGDDAYVIHTPLSTAALRDWLRELLDEGENVFVAEFEIWSSHGAGVDAKWLLARGH